MSDNRSLLQLLVGVLLGSIGTIAWFSAQMPSMSNSNSDSSITECKSNDLLASYSNRWSKKPSNQNIPTNNWDTQANQCNLDYNTNLEQPETARLIAQLDRSRNILSHDLSRLNHWNSFSSFSKTLDQLVLGNSSREHLLAKAHIFYASDYISALESLFSAQQSANNAERLEMFQAEIDVLLDYVRRQYFSGNSLIAINTFTSVMNLANEKQPNNVEVLVALVRHHMLVGEYGLAENYIARVPPDVDNLVTIDQLNRRLAQTLAASLDSDNGIPLLKLGNHFIVEVKFNQEHTLNLMLDTGASRTVLSTRSMRVLRSMSEGVTDLKISGHAETANGFAFTKLYQTEQISVSDFHIDNALILVMNLSENQQFDGLLGMDFLSRFEFRIDYQENRLHLSY
jgi:clan AA aspartic protease (TIGR02281 family)